MAPCKVLSVSVDYSFYDRLNILLSEFNSNIENSEFTDNVTVSFSVRENTVPLLQDKLTQLSNGKYIFKKIGIKSLLNFKIKNLPFNLMIGRFC